MATYEFICEVCNELTTTSQSMKEDLVVPDCPKCNLRMNRIYNTPGIQFKGTGFYKTGG